jgi:hypothetical protein
MAMAFGPGLSVETFSFGGHASGSTQHPNPSEWTPTALISRDYNRCLRDLSRVNIITMTHRPTLSWLHGTQRQLFVLDVACGRGDAPAENPPAISDAKLTGIDLNPWACRAAKEATDPSARIEFINDDAFAYRAAQNLALRRHVAVHASPGWTDQV